MYCYRRYRAEHSHHQLVVVWVRSLYRSTFELSNPCLVSMIELISIGGSDFELRRLLLVADCDTSDSNIVIAWLSSHQGNVFWNYTVLPYTRPRLSLVAFLEMDAPRCDYLDLSVWMILSALIENIWLGTKSVQPITSRSVPRPEGSSDTRAESRALWPRPTIYPDDCHSS